MEKNVEFLNEMNCKTENKIRYETVGSFQCDPRSLVDYY